LQQGDVFAVTAVVGRIGPPFLDAVDVHVGGGDDVLVDLGVDCQKLLPVVIGQRYAHSLGADHIAFADVTGTEFEVADRLRGQPTGRHEWLPQGRRLICRSSSNGSRSDKYCRGRQKVTPCPITHNTLPVTESTMAETILFEHKGAETS